MAVEAMWHSGRKSRGGFGDLAGFDKIVLFLASAMARRHRGCATFS